MTQKTTTATSVLDNAKEHFKESLANGLEKIAVPEWNTTVYFKPSVNFATQQRVIKLHQEGKLAEALVETLIARALDKDGKRMFGINDATELMHQVDPDVIVKVCTYINTFDKSGEKSLGN